MGDIMNRVLRLCIKVLFVSTILTMLLSSAVLANDNTIDIVVSPHVLNIESNGGSISIHTDIGFGLVEDTTVKVNGQEIEVISTFADDCGNLVVKCSTDEVKGIVIYDESADFVLTCNSGSYIGENSIRVIRVIPQKP